jgi:energy-coupling factor transporter ATP-binding protein EcfA2
MSVILEFKDFGFRYTGNKEFTVRDINFRIRHGEFVMLSGPSGGGKTTLARAMVGLIPHFYMGEMEGSVLIDGVSTKNKEVKEISRTIGYVFQNPDNQIFMTTVIRDVAFRLEFMDLPKEEMINRVRYILDKLGIADLMYRRVETLSGGEKQKVAIAGVLVAQPKVLILDEPTAYLSPKSALGLMKLLDRLNKELGITIILIDHRMDLAIQYVKRMIVLYNGRIVLDASTKDALETALDKLYGINIPTISRLYHIFKRWGYNPPSPIIEAEDLSRYILKEVVKA